MGSQFFLFLLLFFLLFLFFFLLCIRSGVVFDLLFWLDFFDMCLCALILGFGGASRSLAPALPRVLLNSPLAMLTHVPAAPQPRATAPPCCLLSSQRCRGSGWPRAQGFAGPGHEAQPRASAGALRASAGRREGGMEGSAEMSPRLQRSPSLPI